MDSKSFISKLKSIKRELLAIKTAHERGLGVANFNTDTGQATYTVAAGDYPFLKITIQFDETVVDSPYCQCYINNTQYFQPIQMSWDDNSNRIVVIYQCYTNNVSLDMYAKVIATKPILGITIEGIEYV